MPRLRALDDLRRARDGALRLSPKGWYLTVLAAGGHVDEAEAAHNAEVRRALKAGERPGETV